MTRRQTLATASFIACVMGSACRPGAVPASDHDMPTLNVTHWTDKTELFKKIWIPAISAEQLNLSQ